ncbi:Cystathionine beta-lyase PatB [bioreactor metagenome]|uniref:cysteine-S-conjugate beta-lyase n=1 Tax=bioreactor metagenome TaxID=1076179 RepID=A0A645AJF9_9ZZZZ
MNEALARRAAHGIYGYSDAAGPDYFDAVAGWYARRFGWTPQPRWLIKTPGVVYAICAAIRTYTRPGDAVLIQPPVYYPFSAAVLDNDRELVLNQLVCADGRYGVDLEDFERKIAERGVKLFILCSPHNPVGRVWTRAELTAMGKICLRHGVLVVSDEIHADFVYPGHAHLVFAGLSPALADITVTCTAPSKTFNLAGLQISNIFISNPELRKRFIKEMDRTGYSQPNLMGLLASREAYLHGEDWLEGLKAHLLSNLALVRQFLAARLPAVKLVEPEGTYLVWLDCRGLGLSDEELGRLIVHKAGLWLDEGAMFGVGGEGFQRINIACPRPVLEEALERLGRALAGNGPEASV